MNNDLQYVSKQPNVGQPEEYFMVTNKAFMINKIYHPQNGEIQYYAPVDRKVVSRSMPQYYIFTSAPEESAQPEDLLQGYAKQEHINETADADISEVDNKVEHAVLTSPGCETIEQSSATAAISEVSTDHCYSTTTTDDQTTEIILNEQQCEMLDKKGWILLSVNNRIYKLDASGLQDITDDPKMLLQCRDDADETTNPKETIEITNEPSLDAPEEAMEASHEMEYPEVTDVFPNQMEEDCGEVYNDTKDVYVVERIETDEVPIDTYQVPVQTHQVPVVTDMEPIVEHTGVTETGMQETVVKSDKQKKEKKTKRGRGKKDSFVAIAPIKPTDPKISHPFDYVKHINDKKKILRVPIKTAFKITQIPTTICLGKMTNGKKLYARLKGEDQRLNVFTKKYPVVKRLVIDLSKSSRQQDYLEHSAEIELCLEQAMNSQMTMCTDQDIIAAQALVTDLFQYSQMHDAIHGRNIIITKFQRNIDEKVTKGSTIQLSFTVAGRAVQFDKDSETWHFLYVPHLLGEILKNNVDYESYSFEVSVNGEPLRHVVDYEKEIQSIVHIHVSEITHSDGYEQIIVTVTRRDIPLKPVVSEKIEIINEARHACSSCAGKFTSEKALIQHQKESCLESQDTKDGVENMLTVDIPQQELQPRKISTKGIEYTACRICEMKFTKLSNYRRHMRIHYGPSSDEGGNKEGVDNKPKRLPQAKQEYYKCRMCPASYIHAPTLSRHILKTHIKALGLN